MTRSASRVLLASVYERCVTRAPKLPSEAPCLETSGLLQRGSPSTAVGAEEPGPPPAAASRAGPQQPDGGNDHGLPRCRYGANCPFRALGRCLFGHFPEDGPYPTDGAPQLAVLERRTLPEGATGHSLHSIFAPWARRVNPTDLVVHDPYLCSIRRASLESAVSDTLDGDALVMHIERVGMECCTALARLDELVSIVNAEAPNLSRVVFHSRGQLRQDAPAGMAFQRWEEQFRSRWSPRGVHLEAVHNPRLHYRRCVLQGHDVAIEVCLEWGLAYHTDTADNMRLPMTRRRVRQTDLLVLEHRGGWHEPNLSGPDGDTLQPPDSSPPEPVSARPGTDALVDVHTARSQLAHCLRSILIRGRYRSWKGRIWCTRCREEQPARGAMLQSERGGFPAP